MGEGHFIKSVAIRWELVHTDDYLRSNPALVTLCTLLGVVYTASEVLLGRCAGKRVGEKCAQRRRVYTTRRSAHTSGKCAHRLTRPYASARMASATPPSLERLIERLMGTTVSVTTSEPS